MVSADEPNPGYPVFLTAQDGTLYFDIPPRPMRVQWLPDDGRCDEPDIHYAVRWEAGPVNHGDRPVPKVWPDAAPLRVIEIRSLTPPDH